MPKYDNRNAATVKISPEKSSIVLHEFQETAMKKMSELNKKSEFSGLLVLPTGAGKTMTATYWLLKNATDKRKKVLWIAHRHLLLDQAAETFVINSYKKASDGSDFLANRISYKYRIISGKHDKPKDIQGDEDILICGKDSIVKNLAALDKWMDGSDLFLVIDEAHHSVARTYRKIIDEVKSYAGKQNTFVKMLGLSATPYRTDEKEKAALGHIFTDDIIYSISLDTLIKKGILSTPIFNSYETSVLAGDRVTSAMIRNISFSDELPKDLAEEIAKNGERNNLIVRKYMENIETYGQTIVFALNVMHAIELKAVFDKYAKEYGNNVKTDFVVSALRDSITGVNRSKEENEKAVERYRNGEIQVLINVNILTEGTDLPQTKTVFLTRPTVSRVLMTQMVGRALRGEAQGGTKEAYIVSFIDNWEDKIAFESPESILLEGSPVTDKETAEYRKQNMRYIAVSLVEEFARIVDETVDTRELENLPFSERIPLGLYMVSYQEVDSENEVSMERNHASLVYSSSKSAYDLFIADISSVIQKFGIAGDQIDDSTICKMIDYCRDTYFSRATLPPVKDMDIEAILKYYAYSGREPEFIPIDQMSRDKANLSYIAQDSLDRELSRQKEREYLLELWNDDSTLLKLFYTEYEYFKRQYDKEVDKIMDDKVSVQGPKRTWEQRELEEMTLQQWIEHEPASGKKLKEEVFMASKENGKYKCVYCGLTSPMRKDFQIDHIKPMSKGGLTVKDNLQLLCRKCNWIKSDHEDDLPLASREISEDILPGMVREGNRLTFSLGDEEKHFEITEYRRERGSLTFVMGGHSYRYTIKTDKLEKIR